MKIAVDVCIGDRGVSALECAGHHVVWCADHGERDEIWFAQALRRGAEIAIAQDRDIEILCYDNRIEFFKVEQFETDIDAVERFIATYPVG